MSWVQAATAAAEIEREMIHMARFMVARLTLLMIIVTATLWLTGCDAAINMAINAVGSTVWNSAAR